MGILRRYGEGLILVGRTLMVRFGIVPGTVAPGEKLPGPYPVDTTGAVDGAALVFSPGAGGFVAGAGGSDGDRTASGIRTLNTVVNVSAAAEPVTGAVLRATGTVSATWQLLDAADVGAAAALTYVAVAGDVTLAVANKRLGVTTIPGGAVAIALPPLASCALGDVLVVCDENGNASAGVAEIVLTRAGSDTIQGATSIKIDTQWGSLQLYRGTTQWVVSARVPA